MEFETIATTLGIIATIPVYKGWVINALRWNKQRKVNSLEKQLTHYNRLKNDNLYFIGWFGEAILIVLALLSSALMFEGVAIDSDGEKLSKAFISLIATVAYVTAVYKAGQYKRFSNYEDTIDKIEKEIEMLKS
ncbi:MAG: hypothetical protein ABW098_19165 [Candidatus Thiodiazotropha sp.]